MDLEKIQVDPQAEVDGVWVPLDEDTKIRVARINNTKYRLAMIEAYRESGITAETATHEEILDILVEVMAKTILVGWEGLTFNDEPIPFTPEKAEEIMKDATFHVFTDIVTQEANRIENFRVRKTEEDLGKSPATSDGE